MNDKHRKITAQKNSNYNSKMVTLIKDKLLPLNRLRYEHLQKITKTLKRQQYSLNTSFSTQTLYSNSQSLPRKGITSRPKQSEADILLHRLKHLTATNQVWNVPTSRLIEPPKPSFQDQPKSTRTIANDEGGSSKKVVPLIDIVTKAETHLRIKKRQLKQRYTQQMGGMVRVARISDLQGVLNNLRGKGKGFSEQQLQKQLLKDIRSNLLEQKMNKLKRDINHKKIVQMR